MAAVLKFFFNITGLFDPENYEIQLPDFDLGYVSFSGISPLLRGFTLCFWIKTTHDGFFIEYKVPREQGESLQLGCYVGNETIKLQLKTTRRCETKYYLYTLLP